MRIEYAERDELER
jgi:hypothetical protein